MSLVVEDLFWQVAVFLIDGHSADSSNFGVLVRGGVLRVFLLHRLRRLLTGVLIKFENLDTETDMYTGRTPCEYYAATSQKLGERYPWPHQNFDLGLLVSRSKAINFCCSKHSFCINLLQ